MKDNMVVNGLNIGGLLDSIQKMLISGAIDKNTIVTIDVLDGYRHGIQQMFLEDEGVLTISAKVHDDF